MALFVTRHDSPLSPQEAWDRLTTWPEHAKYVPRTTISITTPGPNAVGTIFVARTHLGPLSFDDPMELVEWSPPAGDRPGCCRLIKRGTVMLGWAELEVAPHGSGSRATWTEEITVAPIPKWADAVTRVSSRLMFSRVLRRLLADEPPTDRARDPVDRAMRVPASPPTIGGAMTEPVRRVHYFLGQLLSADDLRAEQDYHRSMRYLHNRILGSGVVSGFDVSAAGSTVQVSPGVAIDALGREIVLVDQVSIDAAAVGDPDATVDVVASWAQVPDQVLPDLVEQPNEQAFGRWLELPSLTLGPSGQAPAESLVLARLFREGGEITAVDLSCRPVRGKS